MIPKPDGSQRPLGVPTVKDRIVQMAVKIAIEPVSEADFKDCSYGFRPKRDARQALEKVRKACNNKGYYVVDADIEKFFDQVNRYQKGRLSYACAFLLWQLPLVCSGTVSFQYAIQIPCLNNLCLLRAAPEGSLMKWLKTQ